MADILVVKVNMFLCPLVSDKLEIRVENACEMKGENYE